MYTEKKNSCLFNFNKIFSTHFFLRQHMEKIDKRGLLPEIYEKHKELGVKYAYYCPIQSIGLEVMHQEGREV